MRKILQITKKYFLKSIQTKERKIEYKVIIVYHE